MNIKKVNIFDNLQKCVRNTDNEIPLVINEKVLYFLSYYQRNGKVYLQNILDRASIYIPTIRKIFNKNNLPEELIFLPVIESGFNPEAYSRKKASGKWQFVPGTARLYDLRCDWWIDERRDTEKSTIAAAKHIKALYSEYKDWYLSLAAYNAGGGKINKAIKKYKSHNFWDLIGKKKNFLKKETQNYVPKFIAISIILKNYEKFGLRMSENIVSLSYDIVTIPDATDLKTIAECAGCSYEDIKLLNPELCQWATPPNYKDYQLRIPQGKKTIFEENFNKIPPEERITYRRHKVKYGENLIKIAKLYRVDKRPIIELNNIKNPGSIRAGTYLIIPIRGLENAKEIDKITEKQSNTKG